MTRVSATAAAPQPPKADLRKALDEFIVDINSIFVPIVFQPSVGLRIEKVLASIDWSAPEIVLWVPGTNAVQVPDGIARAFTDRGHTQPVVVPYTASWKLQSSMADGEQMLVATLQAVMARRRPGQKIVLMGESQGAWLISTIMKDPGLASQIHRASLLAHPAMASAHAHETSSGAPRLGDQAREFNDPNDVVSKDIGTLGPYVTELVDAFANLRLGKAAGMALSVVVKNPGLVQALIGSQLFRVKGTANPHNTDDDAAAAVAWALG